MDVFRRKGRYHGETVRESCFRVLSVYVVRKKYDKVFLSWNSDLKTSSLRRPRRIDHEKLESPSFSAVSLTLLRLELTFKSLSRYPTSSIERILFYYNGKVHDNRKERKGKESKKKKEEKRRKEKNRGHVILCLQTYTPAYVHVYRSFPQHHAITKLHYRE